MIRGEICKVFQLKMEWNLSSLVSIRIVHDRGCLFQSHIPSRRVQSMVIGQLVKATRSTNLHRNEIALIGGRIISPLGKERFPFVQTMLLIVNQKDSSIQIKVLPGAFGTIRKMAHEWY
jgi:hypothetical protein